MNKERKRHQHQGSVDNLPYNIDEKYLLGTLEFPVKIKLRFIFFQTTSNKRGPKGCFQ